MREEHLLATLDPLHQLGERACEFTDFSNGCHAEKLGAVQSVVEPFLAGGSLGQHTPRPGTLTINGNCTQTAAGVLQMEQGGLTPGSGLSLAPKFSPAILSR